MSLLVWRSSWWGGVAGCFAFLVMCGCLCSVFLLRGAVGWSEVGDCGFPGHTHSNRKQSDRHFISRRIRQSPKQSLESILFLIIKRYKERATYYGYYATDCMPVYKPNHSVIMISTMDQPSESMTTLT